MRDNYLLRKGGAGAPRVASLVRRTFSAAPVWGWLMAASGSVSLSAEPISVPNFSFEGPVVPTGFPVSTVIDSWQKSPQPDWFDPSTAGIEWDQLSGVFPNTPVGSGNHIDNLDGNQAAYMIALPTVALFQNANANYAAGLSYTLTVGILGGGGLPEGSTFLLGLYYLDGASQVMMASTPITYTSATFPTATHLIDYEVQTAFLEEGNAAIGKPVGVSLVATSGVGAGYWDLDNIRLEASVVPEPSTWALATVGIGGLWWIGRRRRNR